MQGIENQLARTRLDYGVRHCGGAVLRRLEFFFRLVENAEALYDIYKHLHFHKTISVEEQRPQKYDRYLRGDKLLT